jgi:hypothetical protein
LLKQLFEDRVSALPAGRVFSKVIKGAVLPDVL